MFVLLDHLIFRYIMITSVLLLILGFGLPFGYFYLTKNPQFGGKLSKEEKMRLESSEHWKKGIYYSKTFNIE